jgi:hypothetical protein
MKPDKEGLELGAFVVFAIYVVIMVVTHFIMGGC